MQSCKHDFLISTTVIYVINNQTAQYINWLLPLHC